MYKWEGMMHECKQWFQNTVPSGLLFTHTEWLNMFIQRRNKTMQTDSSVSNSVMCHKGWIIYRYMLFDPGMLITVGRWVILCLNDILCPNI